MPASSPDNRPIMPEVLGRTPNSLGHNEEPPPPRLCSDRWVRGVAAILSLTLAGRVKSNTAHRTVCVRRRLGFFFAAAQKLARGVSWQGRILFLAAALTLAALPVQAQEQTELKELVAAALEAVAAAWEAEAQLQEVLAVEYAKSREDSLKYLEAASELRERASELREWAAGARAEYEAFAVEYEALVAAYAADAPGRAARRREVTSEIKTASNYAEHKAAAQAGEVATQAWEAAVQATEAAVCAGGNELQKLVAAAFEANAARPGLFVEEDARRDAARACRDVSFAQEAASETAQNMLALCSVYGCESEYRNAWQAVAEAFEQPYAHRELRPKVVAAYEAQSRAWDAEADFDFVYWDGRNADKQDKARVSKNMANAARSGSWSETQIISEASEAHIHVLRARENASRWRRVAGSEAGGLKELANKAATAWEAAAQAWEAVEK